MPDRAHPRRVPSPVEVPIFPALVACLLMLTTSAAPGDAQVIPLRTVPVASGDQFLLVPSGTAAMGGLSLAVDDSIGDAWGNPAKGVFVREPVFFVAPAYYGISDRGGSGRTLPVGGLGRSGSWFGGALLALQQIEQDDAGFAWVDPFVQWAGPRRLGDASARNLFAAAFLGRRLGRGPWSVGLSASGGLLDAMDGVDLLYAGATRIEQSGSVGDVRLGLFREGAEDRLSLLLVHDRVSMTHDVHYVDWRWEDGAPQPLVTSRLEVNEDRTRTWGGQVAWDRDLSAPGWRLGLSGTVNRKSHPKIPNYEIQNIPRDPGTTWAYEAGLGLARTRAATTIGIDVLLQPIWSETWQEADTAFVTEDDRAFEPGDRTIDNDFFFTNVLLRMGAAHRVGPAEIQAGLEVRSYDYELEQIDHVAATVRDQDESWMEWTPTLGAVLRLADLEIGYLGRLTTGTGRPGTAWDMVVQDAIVSAGDFLVAPRAPLTLQDATVTTHQISLRVPIR